MVMVQIPPVAMIAAVPMELNESGTVSFSADESSDQNGEIISYEWDFGDGRTGTGVNVDHTYTRSGEYTATLMVNDNDGLSATNGVSIAVGSPLEHPPSNMRPTVTRVTINPDEEGTGVIFEGVVQTMTGRLWNAAGYFRMGRSVRIPVIHH